VAYQRNNFLFYGSFREVTKEIDDPMVRLEIYEAIIDYSLYGEEPTQLSQLAAIVFKAIKPVMQTQRTNSENGTKGGLAKKKKPASDNSESPLPKNEKARLENSEKPASENSESYRREKIEDRREKIEDSKEKREDNTLMSGEPDGRVVEIVDYLNLVLGTHYKVNGKKTGSLIRSRLKEGYTVEDFKQVITKKHAEWAGTEREKYLRPETLFCADHFEGYLNQMYVAEKSPVQSVTDEWMAWAEREEAKERGDYVDTEGVCEPDGDGDSFLPDFGD
jgi:uncharacterized phage protein (TIGR02220 family)